MGRLAALVLALSVIVASATAGTSDRPAVPILMYHIVTRPPPGAAYPGLYIPRAQLTAETAWLGAHVYRAVTLKQVFHAWGLSPVLLRKLIAAGWEIDSHTLTHPDLRYLTQAMLERDVAGSRAELRHRFGVPAEFFCYPSGRYDARVVGAVRAAGYRGATTVEFGLARPSEPFALDRVRVDSGDGAAGLASKLAALGLR